MWVLGRNCRFPTIRPLRPHHRTPITFLLVERFRILSVYRAANHCQKHVGGVWERLEATDELSTADLVRKAQEAAKNERLQDEFVYVEGALYTATGPWKCWLEGITLGLPRRTASCIRTVVVALAPASRKERINNGIGLNAPNKRDRV